MFTLIIKVWSLGSCLHLKVTNARWKILGLIYHRRFYTAAVTNKTVTGGKEIHPLLIFVVEDSPTCAQVLTFHYEINNPYKMQIIFVPSVFSQYLNSLKHHIKYFIICLPTCITSFTCPHPLKLTILNNLHFSKQTLLFQSPCFVLLHWTPR